MGPRRPPVEQAGGSGGSVVRPHSPTTGEPRGLNARAISQEKADLHQRPGLFQRGSNTGAVPTTAAALSPTTHQQSSQPRERHGSGIQGGVLSGVAPPAAWKKKEGEVGPDAPLRTPRSPLDADAGSAWERRGPSLNEAFSSARNRTTRTTPLEEGSVEAVQQQQQEPPLPLPSANGHWSRFGRKDRPPGEGPIGPPADGSAGFGKFAGYDRKRERQASAAGTPAARKTTDSAINGVASQSGATMNAAEILQSESQQPLSAHVSSVAPETAGTEQEQSFEPASVDSQTVTEPDLAQHASSILGSLRLDEDVDLLSSRDGLGQPVQTEDDASWSPSSAQWLYRDPQGDIQGPFTATDMQSWYEGQYFTDDLMIKRTEDQELRPLAQVLAFIGNKETPFLVRPSEYVGHRLLQERTLQDLVALRMREQQQHQQQYPFHQQQSHMHPHHHHHQHQQHQQPHTPSLDRIPNDVFGGGGAPMNFLDQGFGQMPASPFAANGTLFGAGAANAVPGSPFAGDFDPRFRLRNQDEYLAMVRQRELEEHRQRTAASPFAAHLGVAQSPGGVGSPWIQPSFGASQLWDSNLQPGQQQHLHQQHQQQQQQAGNGVGFHQQQPYDHAEIYREPFDAAQNLQQGQQEPQQHHQHQEETIQERETEQQQQQEELAQAAEKEQVQEQKEHGNDVAASTDVQVDDHENVVPREPEVVAQEPEESSPEQIWPQSPTAVQFASEPVVTQADELKQQHQQQLEMIDSPSRKKNRRQRGKHTDDSSQRQQSDKASQAPHSGGAGNVKVVSEDDFRRQQQQDGAYQDGQSQQVPLSAWMTDSSSETPSAAAGAKAPWAGAAESQGGAVSGTSLREIQEAEARQAEARKAALAERQRALAANRSSSSSNTQSVPTSMTWGLASVPPSVNRTDSPPSGGTPAAPVWNAGNRQTPKKTLTEIQEEEKKRAQRVKDAQGGQAGLTTPTRPKGYADLATRHVQGVPGSTSHASPSSGGSWSVVGAGGKPSTPTGPSAATSQPVAHAAATASAARPASSVVPQGPAALRANSGGSPWTVAGSGSATTPVRPSGLPTNAVRAGSLPLATARPRGAAQGTLNAATTAPTASAASAPSAAASGTPGASPEFLQYCREQLKGLNVKVDDFIEMLLTFPLDPAPDMVDIIAESVYTNSSTLDGKRFAADFVGKRKLDAANSRTGGGAGLSRTNGTAGGSKGTGDMLRSQQSAHQQQHAHAVAQAQQQHHQQTGGAGSTLR